MTAQPILGKTGSGKTSTETVAVPMNASPRSPALPPADYKRPFMPLSVKLRAALRLAGLDPDNEIEYDHRPSLANRPYDSESGDFWPRANDDHYIVPREKAVHRTITAEEDAPSIAKTRRRAKAQAAHVAVMSRDSVSEPARQARKRAWPKGRKLQSRPFQRRGTK